MLITAERVITADAAAGVEGARTLAPATVRVEGDAVAEVREGRDPAADVHLTDGVLAPGLVDLQVNGYHGFDLVDADADGWRTICGGLPETGVTSFLPTFITAPVDTLATALRRTAEMLPDVTAKGGSRPLGVHLEGPFLSAKKRGAHNEEWLADPTPEAVSELLGAVPPPVSPGSGPDGLLRMVTLAPEREGAPAAIRQLTGAGVLVSLGHSDATAAQAAAGVDAGARSVTHLFNGQRSLHHREPGLPGRALTDSRLTCGLVADLHHVAPEACRLAFAAASGRVALVTDAVAAAGMPPGTYVLGGESITVEATGQPPLRADGTLAGSGLRLDDAVGNMVHLGVGLVTAVEAASRVPADLIGRADLGRITPGAKADLTWLSDDMRARATWVGGKLLAGEAGGSGGSGAGNDSDTSEVAGAGGAVRAGDTDEGEGTP